MFDENFFPFFALSTLTKDIFTIQSQSRSGGRRRVYLFGRRLGSTCLDQEHCRGKIRAYAIEGGKRGVELGDFIGNPESRLVRTMYLGSGSVAVAKPYSCYKSQ
jgi:hypothetical protein